MFLWWRFVQENIEDELYSKDKFSDSEEKFIKKEEAGTLIIMTVDA